MGFRCCRNTRTLTSHIILSMRFTKIIILTVIFYACNSPKHNTTKSDSAVIGTGKSGMTKQDGEQDSEDIHDALLKKGIKTKGFCYYHWQDIERVVDDTHLYIGFGDFNNNDKDALEVGKQVAAALEEQGFKLNWDKTA